MRVNFPTINRRRFMKGALLAAPWVLGNPLAGIGRAAPPRTFPALEPRHVIKSPRLEFGDVVGVVAPASPPADSREIDEYATGLERLGFKPKLAPNVRERLGFLAGTDRQRADDLMTLFADPEVKAIFCVRGGYGSGRLLPLLDYSFIHRHPKILVGFSDITSLHCALLRRARLVSFHGPTLNTSLMSDDPPTFVLHSLWKALMVPTPPGSLIEDYPQNTVSIINEGTATGRLIGGNLSVLSTTLGTPYEPIFAGNILFFEEVDEDPYSVDRMLTHLLTIGLLQQVAGVAVGINRSPAATGEKANGYTQSIGDVLTERLKPLGVPVVKGLPFGHVHFNGTLPVGTRAVLDANKGDLIITESAVA